jgi:hypothetical protein
MIIRVADDNALSRELIREFLQGSDPADKFRFQQIFGIAPRSLTHMLIALRPL